jgi:perosamine synthetase
VAELEAKLRRYYGVRHALSVSSATSGLMALALALDLRSAEFVTTPYTFGGTLAGWLMLGNRPRFADIGSHDLGLDADAARRLMTPATKAVLAVDIFGIPSDCRALRRLADDFGIWYIADAAQSLGSLRDGLPGSALADALVVSFTAGKTIFAGEGGAILTNHSDLYDKLLWFSQHPERQRREVSLAAWNDFGLNARIHPLAAVWANATFDASLVKLHQHQRRCSRVVGLLNRCEPVDRIEFADRDIVPSFCRLTASWKASAHPEELLARLAANGIGARIEPSPVRLVYRQPAFQAQYTVDKPECPVAERQETARFCVMRNADSCSDGPDIFVPAPSGTLHGREQA